MILLLGELRGSAGNLGKLVAWNAVSLNWEVSTFTLIGVIGGRRHWLPKRSPGGDGDTAREYFNLEKRTGAADAWRQYVEMV